MLTLTAPPGVAASAGIDGSKPMLCSVITVMECDATWKCERHEDGGRLAAGIVADDFTFALFGACTTP